MVQHLQSEFLRHARPPPVFFPPWLPASPIRSFLSQASNYPRWSRLLVAAIAEVTGSFSSLCSSFLHRTGSPDWTLHLHVVVIISNLSGIYTWCNPFRSPTYMPRTARSLSLVVLFTSWMWTNAPQPNTWRLLFMRGLVKNNSCGVLISNPVEIVLL